MDNIARLRSQHINVAMKVLFETKLQHQGYESHQYSIYYENKRFENKCLQCLHENKNHWILVALNPSNTYMPCILHDLKTSHDKILCANTKIKINELINIDNFNYIYTNVMQQHDQSSCDLFGIAYATNIAFNINVKKSKYAISKMRQHYKKKLLKCKIYHSFSKTSIYM
jgi:hypothetical protein